MRWVDRYQVDEEIKRHNRKPVAYKVQKEHVKFILAELKNRWINTHQTKRKY
jgi:hypothetical protein